MLLSYSHLYDHRVYFVRRKLEFVTGKGVRKAEGHGAQVLASQVGDEACHLIAHTARKLHHPRAVDARDTQLFFDDVSQLGVHHRQRFPFGMLLQELLQPCKGSNIRGTVWQAEEVFWKKAI